MEKIIQALQQTFESSSSRTQQYLDFHKLFDDEFTKVLAKLNCVAILISAPNHFDVSGFFTSSSDQIWYFNLSDLRWSKDKLLIRTATHYKDYTGGSNEYIKFDKNFISNLKFIIKER